MKKLILMITTAMLMAACSAGPQGAAGPTGPEGPVGAAGKDGVAGAIGPTGPQGVAGPTGAQGAAGTAGVAGAVGPTGPQGPAGSDADAGALFMAAIVPSNGAQHSPYDLWKIQPGLGTVMIEYGTRMNNAWYAAHASTPNWDMVLYQVTEMTEIQEVGEITRPGRATLLKNFEQQYLTTATNSLIEVAKAAQAGTKTVTDFETAYDAAIVGCNACHAGSTSSDFPNGYKFVKVMRPTAPGLHNLDWLGQ